MTADEIRAVNYADVEDKKPDDWAENSGWDKGAIPFFLREIAAQLAEMNKQNSDNPRCFCPECGADLGSFYSNRMIRMVSGVEKKFP